MEDWEDMTKSLYMPYFIAVLCLNRHEKCQNINYSAFGRSV
jgi:hypothetical protein